VVLGFADRGEDVRRRGSGAGRRGNSAGQAAVFLSAHASKVWMLVRGAGLAASMSKYLIDRIAATPNIELLTRTQHHPSERFSRVGCRVGRMAQRLRPGEQRPIRHVFLFLGADPSTEWLRDCEVSVDEKGSLPPGTKVRCLCRRACRVYLRSATCGPDP
jgi:thioredoxin reductase (NADPH)